MNPDRVTVPEMVDPTGWLITTVVLMGSNAPLSPGSGQFESAPVVLPEYVPATGSAVGICKPPFSLALVLPSNLVNPIASRASEKVKKMNLLLAVVSFLWFIVVLTEFTVTED
jgi:hypothetical protein